MMIGHLPAGYLASHAIAGGFGRATAGLVATGMVASVAPDLDLFWFYLVDHRQHLHHDYLFHAPAFWVAVALLAWAIARLAGWAGAGLYIAVALANLLLHMVLDTLAGGIRWLWPISDRSLVLVTVPAGQSWWVWNFVLHWTFLLEMALVVAAAALAALRWRAAAPSDQPQA
jgi:inner membrane protein